MSLISRVCIEMTFSEPKEELLSDAQQKKEHCRSTTVRQRYIDHDIQKQGII